MNDVCKLIKQQATANEVGDAITTETSREVFCGVSSIGVQEFYQSQAVGMRPEIRVTLADYYDYDGEQIVELDGVRYTVIRTYRKDINLELTLSRGVISDGSA